MEPQPGEIWAYRARAIDPLTPVRVVRHGTRQPPRVFIAFEDDSMEGREEWVPPGRLKVPWDRLDSFLAEEARWESVRVLSPRYDDVESYAALAIFEPLIPADIAQLHKFEGVFEVHDAPALAEFSGLSIETLIGHQVSFEHDGVVIAPWPVMLELVQQLCRRMPDAVLASVDREERKFQDELIHGFTRNRYEPYRNVDHEIEIVREVDEQGWRQSRDLRRQWCGVESNSRWDELVELRKEIRRVGVVAESAITVLRGHGYKSDADRLSMELGETVEMLRVD